MDRKRATFAALGLFLLTLTAYVLLNFIASIVFAVFLYYSSRPIYNRLRVFGMHRRLRAVATLVLFALPFLLLFSYTAVLFVGEVQFFIEQYDVDASSLGRIFEEASGFQLPDLTVQGVIEAYRSGNYTELFDTAIQQGGQLVGIVASTLIRFAIMALIVYYLLVDGPRLRRWVTENFDDEALDDYFTAVDHDLAVILFGNILNAFLTAIIGITVYYAYNTVAPGVAEVPFPALVGALTGIGSLIPVIGMKIVYWPVGALMALATFMSGETGALVYVLGFFVLSFVVVDLIPDIVLRPYVSGRNVHMGLLLFAYVMGPLVFGFYGLFLAPILLVLLVNFAQILLPHLVGDGQTALADYAEE